MISFIFKLVNFILFVLILYKLLRDPILRFLEKEKKNILKRKEELEAEKSRLEQAIKELDLKIENAKKEAEHIIKLAEKRAKRKREEILKDVERVIDEYKSNMEKRVEEEIHILKSHLKEMAVNEAIKEAEKILKDKLTQKEDREFIKRSLYKL